jgi:hypothetical protein
MSDTDGIPAVQREGGRAYISVPIDSPYRIRLLRENAKWDVVSERWWVGVAKAERLEQVMQLPLGHPIDDAPEEDEGAERQPSAAKLLVDLALSDYTLGITDTEEPFGVHADKPHIAMMLRSGRTGLRAELAHRFWNEYQLPAPQQAIADACMVLEGMSMQEKPQRVFLRVGEYDGAVYIDMGDVDGHVIEIADGSWDVGIRAPVLFRRTKLTAAMPTPFADGDYNKLWYFVPVDPDDHPLILAWLVQALIRVDVPHPVLGLIAEHGSVKSGSTRCLGRLVDPSSAQLRKEPRDADAWVTAAYASWIVGIDNLSGVIPRWLSDCLCRAVTGDGDVRRALYTDQDVSVISMRRVVMFNGIDVEVTQGDLADRLLRAKLPRVSVRRQEAEVEADWEKAWPDILGGLLTLAANVHGRLASVTVADLPRMADYAIVLAAVDQINGTDGLTRYREQAKSISADTLDSPFIAAIISARYSCEDSTSKQILAAVTPKDEKWRRPKGWPGGARAVTGQLTRNAPAMRAQGWHIDNDEGKNHEGIARWTIVPPDGPEKACKDDPPSPPDPSTGSDLGFQGGLGGGSDNWEDNPVNPHDPDGGLTDDRAGNEYFDNPPENTPPTSDNGPAGQAGQEYKPSLADELFDIYPAGGDARCGCGNSLVTPEAISSGKCKTCRDKAMAR